MWALSLAVTIFGCCITNAATTSITSTADIFSAGQAIIPSDGTAAPMFAASSSFRSALRITNASGSIFTGCLPLSGPDGGNPCAQAATKSPAGIGLSAVRTEGAFFLAGVFLLDSAPLEPAPATLDFANDGLGKSFDSLSPKLAQVFFIGDGRTEAGSVQNFFVPAGATRLALGTIDNCGGGIGAHGVLLRQSRRF